MWTGVEVAGVRGSGEWLGVEMGDPARGGQGRALKKGSQGATAACTSPPDTILQLMVIGWKDFPGDSAGLGAWP